MISINKVLEHTLKSKKIILYAILSDLKIESENELKKISEVKALLKDCRECSVSNQNGTWNVEVVMDV
jgi:hypothetical protein